MLQLAGSRAQPEINGQLRASQLLARAPLAGLQIDDGNLTLDLMGERALIQGQLVAPGGSALISGQLNWNPQLQGELRLAGLNWPVEHELAQLRLDSDLQLQVAEPELTLAGTVTVREGLVRVAELPPTAVAVSSDERLISRGQLADEGYWQTRMQLLLKLGDKLRLEAFGLTGRLTGQLRAEERGEGLQLLGEVAVRDGRFKAYGQNLIMRRATLGLRSRLAFLTRGAVRLSHPLAERETSAAVYDERRVIAYEGLTRQASDLLAMAKQTGGLFWPSELAQYRTVVGRLGLDAAQTVARVEL